MDIDAWIRRQLAGGWFGGLLGPTPPAADPNRGYGMMAGVKGFDPSDPGAYANRTASDNDLRGYGGSPRLPDAPTFNHMATINAGLDLMRMGEPSGPAMPTWQPQASPIHRPQMAAMASLEQIFPNYAAMYQPDEVLLMQQMAKRRRPMGLLSPDRG